MTLKHGTKTCTVASSQPDRRHLNRSNLRWPLVLKEITFYGQSIKTNLRPPEVTQDQKQRFANRHWRPRSVRNFETTLKRRVTSQVLAGRCPYRQNPFHLPLRHSDWLWTILRILRQPIRSFTRSRGTQARSNAPKFWSPTMENTLRQIRNSPPQQSLKKILNRKSRSKWQR